MLRGLLIAVAVAAIVYALVILALVVAGRRSHAKALARFVPDCAVLFRRLMADRRVSRPRKALLGLLVAYLAMPFDLIPDFIPVAGQLDDAILVALTLRAVLRDAGPGLVREHWPGPPESLEAMLRLAGGR
ncbi:MAG: YkvA family protein [Thermoleophilaceae bacterium]|jgi:uncharacterized membrane protein YkvA (DUF1232 family)